MSSTRDIIIIIGIIISVTALSFVVKLNKIFFTARLIIGLEVIFKAEDINVLKGNGFIKIVNSKKDKTLIIDIDFIL